MGEPSATGSDAAAAPSRRTDVTLAVFCLGWLGCLAIAAVVCRPLYGDGAYVVLAQIREAIKYIDYDTHRSFASYITQTPGLLGRRLGALEVTTYARLYSIGVYALPAALFLAALALARRLPALFAVAAAAVVVFGFGANFVNTEALLFLAFAWLAAVLLALPGRHPWLRGFALPMIAFVLLRVYEGMLLAGPVLALWSFVQAQDHGGSQEQIGLTLSALLFAIASFIGFSSFVAPRDPGNASSFAESVLAYLHNPQVFVLLATLCSLGVIAVRTDRARTALTIACAMLAAIFVWATVKRQGYYAYTLYYYNRSFLVFLLPLAIAALWGVQRRRPAWLSRPLPKGTAMAMVLPFAAVVTVDLLGSVRWYHYMKTFCDVLDRPATAATGIEQLKRSGAMTGWAWTHPTLSILLRAQGSEAVVQNDPVPWQPPDREMRRDSKYRGACEDPLFRVRKRP